MIGSLPGWSRGTLAGAQLLLPPGGPEAGWIRYLERNRPILRAFDAIGALPIPGDARLGPLSRPRALVTDEGEYGCLVTADATQADRPCRRAFGLVYVDDFYSLCVGHGRSAELAAAIDDLVEELTRRQRHWFGIRRRRYLYRSPPGWQGRLVDGYLARFYPPDFPKDQRILSVYPAIPLPGGDSHAALETAVARGAISERSGRTRLGARGGLHGDQWQVRSAGQAIDLALLLDDRYLYPLALEGGDAAVLAAVAGSVEPIPRPRTIGADRGRTFSSWSE